MHLIRRRPSIHTRTHALTFFHVMRQATNKNFCAVANGDGKATWGRERRAGVEVDIHRGRGRGSRRGRGRDVAVGVSVDGRVQPAGGHCTMHTLHTLHYITGKRKHGEASPMLGVRSCVRVYGCGIQPYSHTSKEGWTAPSLTHRHTQGTSTEVHMRIERATHTQNE